MMIKLLETLKRYDENGFPFNQVLTCSIKKRKTVHSRLAILVSFGSKCYLRWYLKSNRLKLKKCSRLYLLRSYQQIKTEE